MSSMSFPGDSLEEGAAMFVGGYISEYPFKSPECQFTIFVAFSDISPPSQKTRQGGGKLPQGSIRPRIGETKHQYIGRHLRRRK
jgi:hypothetical protein